MAKINLNLIAVTEADIISQMNKIEAMLEGRMDDDNIHQVAGKITSLGKASINDIADHGNPVYADKFLAQSPVLDSLYSAQAVNFKTDVFDRIKEYAWYADKFTVISKKGTVTLNYKNQENLEKPSVVIAGDTEGMSLATQRQIASTASEQRAKAYYDYLNADEEIMPFGQQLAQILIGGVVGFAAGFAAGGPPGAAFGVIGGLAAGAASIASVQAYNNATRPDYDDSYDPYRENIQIMIYKHPSNFRLVSMLELTDLLSQYSDANVRYNSSFIGSAPYSRSDLFSKNLYAISAKASSEDNIVETTSGYLTKSFVTRIGQPMLVDAETTAVAFSVLPYEAAWETDQELIESEDDYITALCEVDVLFRIIT